MKDPAQVAMHANVPGGGEVDVTGTVGVAPRRADLRVRARGLELAALGQLPAADRAPGRHRHRRAARDGHPRAGVRPHGRRRRDGGSRHARRRRAHAAGATRVPPAASSTRGRRASRWASSRSPSPRPRSSGPPTARSRPGRPAAPAPGPADAAAPASPAAGGRRTRRPDHQPPTRRRPGLVTDAASGGRVEVTRLAVSARDVTWPGRGPAAVELTAAVAGADGLGARHGRHRPPPDRSSTRGRAVATWPCCSRGCRSPAACAARSAAPTCA